MSLFQNVQIGYASGVDASQSTQVDRTIVDSVTEKVYQELEATSDARGVKVVKELTEKKNSKGIIC